MAETYLQDIVKLLPFIKKDVEITGQFLCPAFKEILPTIKGRQNIEDERALSPRERRNLIALLQQRSEKNGRVDYYSFDTLIRSGFDDPQPTPEHIPEIKSDDPQPTPEHISEIKSDDPQLTLGNIPEIKSDDPQPTLGNISEIKSDDSQHTLGNISEVKSDNPQLTPETVNVQEKAKLQLRELDILENLCQLIRMEVAKTGEFTFNPFQDILANENPKKSIEFPDVPYQLHLLQMVKLEAQRTGQFNFSDFNRANP